MSEFKGTKGRWIEYDQEPDQVTKTLLAVSGYAEGDHEVFTTYGRNLQEVKANAQLISKAPEMLEMLKEFCNDCDGYDLDYLVGKAQEIIKQATIV